MLADWPLTGFVVVGIINIIDTPITKINAITIGINLLTLIAYDSDLLKGYCELAAPTLYYVVR